MNSKILIMCLGLLICLSQHCTAQELPPENLNGKSLRDWLKENWYEGYHWTGTSDRFDNPVYTDLYRNARREMYNYIDNKNNQLIGVYSGYTIDFEAEGTSTDSYPLNCEHTVPQSFFRPTGEDDSSEPMRSDIHHLFPTYGAWNSTRSNHPFEDIEDARTTKWMYLDKSFTVTPDTDIDAYSEFSNQGYSRFEPREDHKGNVARAILYFYAMYEDNELVFRPIDHVANVEDMLVWHEADPVDDAEKARNLAIAAYQGNQNPFVAHPELVKRAWSVVTSVEISTLNEVMLYPNPSSDRIHLVLTETWNPMNSKVKISNLAGQVVAEQSIESDRTTIDVTQMEEGLYFITIYNHQYTRRLKFKKVN